MDNPDVAKAVNGERKQFEIRRAAREGQKSQLRERIAQLKEEISGYQAQVASKNNQIDWITKELGASTSSGRRIWFPTRGSPRSSARRSGSMASAGS